MTCASCGYHGATYRVPGDPRVFCDERCYWTRVEEAARRDLEKLRRMALRLLDLHRDRGYERAAQCTHCGSRNTHWHGSDKNKRRMMCMDCHRRSCVTDARGCPISEEGTQKEIIPNDGMFVELTGNMAG